MLIDQSNLMAPGRHRIQLEYTLPHNFLRLFQVFPLNGELFLKSNLTVDVPKNRILKLIASARPHLNNFRFEPQGLKLFQRRP